MSMTFFLSYNDDYNIDDLFSKAYDQLLNIKFTIEKEKDKCLPFLDVYFFRTSNKLLNYCLQKTNFC